MDGIPSVIVDNAPRDRGVGRAHARRPRVPARRVHRRAGQQRGGEGSRRRVPEGARGARAPRRRAPLRVRASSRSTAAAARCASSSSAGSRSTPWSPATTTWPSGRSRRSKAHGVDVPKRRPRVRLRRRRHRALLQAVADHRPPADQAARALARRHDRAPAPTASVVPDVQRSSTSSSRGASRAAAATTRAPPAPDRGASARDAALPSPAQRGVAGARARAVRDRSRRRRFDGWPGELLSALEEELDGAGGPLPDGAQDAPRRGGARGRRSSTSSRARSRCSARRSAGRRRRRASDEAPRAALAHVPRPDQERVRARRGGSSGCTWSARRSTSAGPAGASRPAWSLPTLRRMLASELPTLDLARTSPYRSTTTPQRATLEAALPDGGRPRGGAAAGTFASLPRARLEFLEPGERRSIVAIAARVRGDGALRYRAGQQRRERDGLRRGAPPDRLCGEGGGAAPGDGPAGGDRASGWSRRGSARRASSRRASRPTLVPAHLLGRRARALRGMTPAGRGGRRLRRARDADGGWLGIGDVAGHGLAAGLVMLMIQSMVSALTRRDPSARLSEVVSALNRRSTTTSAAG